MDLFTIITILVVLSAIFGYVNTKYLKFPQTIGLMIMAIFFSLAMLLANYFFPQHFHFAENLIANINFSEVLLDVMLSFLLFAGALHTDTNLLKKERRSISLFSFFGVMISTFFIAGLLFFLLKILGQPIDFIFCLLFGALISPTDPIAVLGILKKAKVPTRIETNIVGESLFNDGVGVVIFLSIMEVIRKGVENFGFGDIVLLLLQEAGGGIAFGLMLGYITFRLLKAIDHYQTEVIITLAIVMGGYLAANFMHISGPLAIVVTGLYIGGSKSRQQAMSQATELYVDKFWELIDVLMNAILFVLIGLEIIIIDFNATYLLIGIIIIPFTLLSRYLALRIPLLITRKWIDLDKKSLLLMTWGGLRGGLSIAMALSLTNDEPKDMFVFITYVVVLFSIVVQGLTVGKMAGKLYPSK